MKKILLAGSLLSFLFISKLEAQSFLQACLDQPPLVVELIQPPCNGSLGKVSVVSPFGPGTFEYSIDGGVNWQLLSWFYVPNGFYTVMSRRIGSLCINSTTVTITSPPIFLASLVITPATCISNTGSIDMIVTGGTPPYQYSSDAGGTWFPTSHFGNLQAGTLYYMRTKDANNCGWGFGGLTFPLIDTMRLDIGPDTSICVGNSITLMPQTNAGTDTFKWTPAIALNYDTVKNPIATPNDTTKYYLHAKWGTCFRDDSITINILHKPIAHAGNDTTICDKTIAILNGSASNQSGPLTHAWTPSAKVSPANMPTAVANPDSTQQYILTVKDNYGCNFTSTDSMLVTRGNAVYAFAGNDTNALLAKPHHLKASGGGTYLWSPAGPLDDPTLPNPTAILHNDTYFRVWVTDSIGCKAFDDVFIKVYDGPNYYLPNAFTPNGDGLNDVFTPIPVGMKRTDDFMVYNRYGERLFQTHEWLKGWDGTIKGKPADQGIYVWMIRGYDENGQVIEMKGAVMLIR